MSKATQVILVSIFAPASDGHGGNHRVYQLLHDCQQAFGAENVSALSLDAWRLGYLAGGRWRRQALRFWRFAGFCRDCRR